MPAVIIAIVFLGSIGALIIFNDSLNHFIGKSKFQENNYSKNKKHVIKKNSVYVSDWREKIKKLFLLI
jgi:hypothetical protein